MDRLWAFFKKDDQQSVPGNTNAALNQKVQDVEELSDRERAIREAVFYAVGHHTERDMLVTRSNIEATALNKSKAMFKIDDVNNELDRLLKNGILVQSDTGKLTTKRLAHSEIWSIDHVREERHSVDKILTEEQIKDDLKEREQFNKFDYTEGQRNSIYSIFTTDSRYHAVDGLAGLNHVGSSRFKFRSRSLDETQADMKRCKPFCSRNGFGDLACPSWRHSPSAGCFSCHSILRRSQATVSQLQGSVTWSP